MPKIVITERDETTAGVYSEKFDVVYIPGFVDVTQDCLWDGTPSTAGSRYKGILVNEPTLFNSVAEFESRCGKKGAVFEEAQTYNMLSPSFSGLSYEPTKEFYNYVDSKKWDKEKTSIETVVSYVSVDNKKIVHSVKHRGLAAVQVYKGTTDTTIELSNYVSDLETKKFGVVLTQKLQLDMLGNVTGATLTDGYICTGGSLHSEDDHKIVCSYAVLNDVTSLFSSIDRTDEMAFTYEAIEGTQGVMFEKGTIDPAYVMAKELLAMGLSVLYERVNGDSDAISISTMYNALGHVYDSSKLSGLSDKGNFSIKYVTSGGYPTFEYNRGQVVTSMIALCANPDKEGRGGRGDCVALCANPDKEGRGGRGDCVALIDHTDNLARTIDPADTTSVFKKAQENETFNTHGEFATMFTPWATYVRTTTDYETREVTDVWGETHLIPNQPMKKQSFRMPASFAYLMSLGDSIKTNANWLAVAGSARGGVINLADGGMTTKIPNGVADAMQPRDSIAVNAITNIKPYGWTIWGNRTLKNNGDAGDLTATSFLNVRNLVSDVKKTVYRVARQLTFEQNNDILWTNFKGMIAPKLDQMVSGHGISGYKIVRDTAHERASKKATVCAQIILYPVYAVEDFYVTIVLRDDEVSVS